MARATVAQLNSLGLSSYALSQLTNAQKTEALSTAEARIDTALASQFDPSSITSWPMDLIECQCVLASWTLLMTLGYNPATGIDENIKTRYLYWENYLTSVAKGELTPQVVGGGSDTLISGANVITATQRGYSERGIDRASPPCPNTDPFSGD